MRSNTNLLALLLSACSSQAVMAQTPSPLQEWQYSGGIILARLFQPDLPTWRTVLGLAAEAQPVYENPAEMGGRGSGLKQHTVSVEDVE